MLCDLLCDFYFCNNTSLFLLTMETSLAKKSCEVSGLHKGKKNPSSQKKLQNRNTQYWSSAISVPLKLRCFILGLNYIQLDLKEANFLSSFQLSTFYAGDWFPVTSVLSACDEFVCIVPTAHHWKDRYVETIHSIHLFAILFSLNRCVSSSHCVQDPARSCRRSRGVEGRVLPSRNFYYYVCCWYYSSLMVHFFP